MPVVNATLADKVRRRIGRELWDVVGHVVPQALFIRKGPAHGRRVGLTFNGGPGDLTGAYLDVLDGFDATATFFVDGIHAVDRPDHVRDIVARGHALGLHGWSSRPFSELPMRSVGEEIVATEQTLPICSLPLVRPPLGAIAIPSALQCWLRGYAIVLWSLDSGDSEVQDPMTLIDNVDCGRVVPGDIIAMSEGRPWTLDALPYVLAGLRSAGFSAVTLPELFGDAA